MESLRDILAILLIPFEVGYIYFCALALALAALYVICKRIDARPELAGLTSGADGLYYLGTILLLIDLLKYTLRESVALLDDSLGITIAIIIFLLCNLAYFVSYNYSLYRFMSYLPGGLRLAKIFVLTLPVMTEIFPKLFWSLCNGSLHGDLSLDHLRRLLWTGFPMWSAFWFLYFSLSSTVRASWAIVENTHRK